MCPLECDLSVSVVPKKQQKTYFEGLSPTQEPFKCLHMLHLSLFLQITRRKPPLEENDENWRLYEMILTPVCRHHVWAGVEVLFTVAFNVDSTDIYRFCFCLLSQMKSTPLVNVHTVQHQNFNLFSLIASVKHLKIQHETFHIAA